MKINTIKPLVDLASYESWRSGWMEKSEIDELSYLSTQCHPEDVLLSSKLFFPDFVVVGEAVFLEAKYEDKVFDCWLKQFEGDLQATEKMINHTHLTTYLMDILKTSMIRFLSRWQRWSPCLGV